jgi:hypothetical protein
MVCPIAPMSASPLLYAALQRIARTPTARLAVGYRILPKYYVCAHCCPPRTLGEALLVDRIATGGNVGDILPLSIVRDLDTVPLILHAIVVERQQADIGNLIDVWA